MGRFFSARAGPQYGAFGVEVDDGVPRFRIGGRADYDKIFG